ncbi:hypothetical protein N7462_006435 [Penicillium macrosclerotiorum]|uniref:uncharacterized protein n=1 Tax=Penicillium macrosclerotiorum TaxID=303699 RepID=UPI002547F424|nr:uncharacterized protein N7462_006435 [Penicillium macrosclerotiorum]KAJ5683270.1 hypothetical protein N7462_006435 [Penicillium macrosclerotiorum]
MADMNTISLKAPSLGAELIGTVDKDNDIALFRGIPYATLIKRWTHSQTKDSLDSVFDATRLGCRCNQLNGLVLVSGGSNDPLPGDDEFECLNLNIALPRESLDQQAAKPLPVMVWIHGGGFAFGANSVARYRPQALVAHARDSKTPIILVSINYRLGALGFSASEDLAQESNGGSKTHPVGNYGIIDQRNALEWVNRHIQDFGGDPSNITVFGVSAGSVSIHMHLLAEHALFDRAIMMSGAAPILSPLPMEIYQKEWERLCQKTGINTASPSERLKQLRALSVDEILKNSSPAAMGPSEDGKLLQSGWTYADNVANTRCKEIILGDTNVEAIIFDGLLRRLSQERFHQLVDEALPSDFAEQLYVKFGFSRELQSEDLFRKAFRLLVGNTLFNYSHVGIANASRNSEAWRDKIHLYHFEEPSPFPGPTQGISYHGLCAMLMHLNEFSNCPPPTQRVSLEVARLWAAFAHGQQPWEPYSQNQKFMRFGPDGESGLFDFKSDDVRDYQFQDWLGENIAQVGRFVRGLVLDLENNDI